MMRITAICAAMLAACASPSAAQQLAADGGLLSVAGKTIALPGAGWRQVLSSASGGRDSVRTVALLRETNGALRALAIVRTNETKRSAIFPTTRRCERLDSYFAEIRYDTNRDGYCQWSSLLRVDWAGAAARNSEADRFTHEISSALEAAGVTKPDLFLQFGARARTIAHVIDMRFYVPSDLPAPLAGAPSWFSGGERAALPAGAVTTIESLKGWSALAQGRLEDSVRLVSGIAPLPDPFAPGGASRPGERLARMDRATLETKLPAPYLDAARQDAARDETPGNDASWSLWKRSLAKVATYRVASGLDSITVGWLITGSAAQGFGFAGIDAVLAPALAYANEIFWATSGVGAPSAPLTPHEFPEIGEEQVQKPAK